MDNYTLIKKLGEGGFGTVYLCQHKITSKQYVLKQIDITSMSPNELKECENEIRLMKSLIHSNIVTCYDTFTHLQHTYGMTTKYLCIIMMYCECGDLEQYIKQHSKLKRSIQENQIIDFLVQILLALKHIHDRKVLHRDLKTANIFLTTSSSSSSSSSNSHNQTPSHNTNNIIVKLGDFGIAKLLDYTLQQVNTQIGTPYYLSPELCNNSSYDHKADCWSVGVVLYEMMSLRYPFTANNINQLVIKILTTKQPPLPTHYSMELRTLCSALLNKNPKHRPSVNEILRLPFIKQHITRFLDAHQLQEQFSHTVLHTKQPSSSSASSAQSNHINYANDIHQQLIALEKQRLLIDAQNKGKQQPQHGVNVKRNSFVVAKKPAPIANAAAAGVKAVGAVGVAALRNNNNNNKSAQGHVHAVKRSAVHQPSPPHQQPPVNVINNNIHSESPKQPHFDIQQRQLQQAYIENAKERVKATARGKQYVMEMYGIEAVKHSNSNNQNTPQPSSSHDNHQKHADNNQKNYLDALAKARQDNYNERIALDAKRRGYDQFHNNAAKAAMGYDVDEDDSLDVKPSVKLQQRIAANKQRAIEEKEAALEKARREIHEERIRLQQKYKGDPSHYNDQSGTKNHDVFVNDGLTARVAEHIKEVNQVVTRQNQSKQRTKANQVAEEYDMNANESLSKLVDDMYADVIADKAQFEIEESMSKQQQQGESQAQSFPRGSVAPSTTADESAVDALEKKQRHAADVVQVMDNLRGILEDNMDTSVPTLRVDEIDNENDNQKCHNDNNDVGSKLNGYKHTHAIVRNDTDDAHNDLMSTQQLHLPDFSDRTMKEFAMLNLDVSLKGAVK